MIESPPDYKQQAEVQTIPLERIEFTPIPFDPRKSLPDYCYTSTDEDAFPWTLPLPTFWREVVRRIEQNVNEERRMNGWPKYPISFIKNQLLQRTQGQQRDPRLKQTLFPQPPRKATTSNLNQTAPNLKSSIFDVENSEDVLSDSSSSLSFSSANGSGPNRCSQPNDNFSLSDVSDDDVLSFNAFNKRRLTDSSTDSGNEKVSPIKKNVKKIEENEGHTLNGTSKWIEYFHSISISLKNSILYILQMFRKSVA